MMADCIDLFCGGGGSSWGARAAGLSIDAGIDIDPVATAVYRENFPEARVLTADLSDVEPDDVHCSDDGLRFLLASPECTNHSPAKGSAPRCEESRASAFEVLRFTEAWRPQWVVAENVVQMRKWNRFEEWLSGFELLNYKILTLVLDAHDFGVPQSRRRLFVVAGRDHLPKKPETGVKGGTAWDVVRMSGCNGWDLSRLRKEGRADATIERAEGAIASVGADNPFLLVYYGSDGAGGFQVLEKPLRTVTTLDRFALVVPSKDGHLMRMLQPTELATAMGFPEAHSWPKVSRRTKIKLLGNAVCPPVMRALVEAQLNAESEGREHG